MIVGYAVGQPVSGITTRLAWGSDPTDSSHYVDDADTNGQGDATHTLSGDGRPPKKGTYYAWLVDKQTGQVISDVSQPIEINGKKDTAGDSCWQAYTYFGPS